MLCCMNLNVINSLKKSMVSLFLVAVFNFVSD